MTQTAKRINNEDAYLIALQDDLITNDTIENRDAAFIIHNNLFGRVNPFLYKDRLRLTFFISEHYKSKFVLIKGIIEFHRAKSFSFRYDKSESVIESDISVEKPSELKTFLYSVQDWTE
jgi:hypothetical protein